MVKHSGLLHLRLPANTKKKIAFLSAALSITYQEVVIRAVEKFAKEPGNLRAVHKFWQESARGSVTKRRKG